jgi:hypothetical protein
MNLPGALPSFFAAFWWLYWKAAAKLQQIWPVDAGGFRPGSEADDMQERWLSMDEIAAHLGANPETIYKWIDGSTGGNCPRTRWGGCGNSWHPRLTSGLNEARQL